MSMSLNLTIYLKILSSLCHPNFDSLFPCFVSFSLILCGLLLLFPCFVSFSSILCGLLLLLDFSLLECKLHKCLKYLLFFFLFNTYQTQNILLSNEAIKTIYLCNEWVCKLLNALFSLIYVSYKPLNSFSFFYLFIFNLTHLTHP